MTPEEIVEANMLIAKFKLNAGNNNAFINDIHPNNLLYHLSWDWLMPVMEIIEKQKYANNDGTDEIFNYPYLRTFHGNMVRINRFQLIEEETRIKSLHVAVVEYIKWYNSNLLKV